MCKNNDGQIRQGGCIQEGWVLHQYEPPLFNRPSVAGAVQQTPSSLTDRVTHPFPPNMHNTINPKPLELGT